MLFDYITRIIDEEIDSKVEAFNAINIVGPKGCGKTRTAKERCRTIIEFQDEEKRDGYITIAETSPSLFLKNEKPILFDECQDGFLRDFSAVFGKSAAGEQQGNRQNQAKQLF